MPGLSKYILPGAAPFFAKIIDCLPPLAALFLMNFIKVDGEPVMAWKDAVASVNWPSYMFIAAIMGLGSFMGNADIGIPVWMSSVLGPAFSGVSPLLFVIIMVFVVDLLTNFCSNSVSLSVVFAVALPLCMKLYDGILSPMMLSILITSSAMNGWATPPATPTAAVAYSVGWSDNRMVLRWGLIFMLVQVILCILVGVPIANLLIP